MARTNEPFETGDAAAAAEGRTRRAAIRDAAKLVVGAGAATQIMAATGANSAVAQTVREAARRVSKPGYGPLVQHTGEMSLPAGFTAIPFGEAFSRMDDGFRTPPCHDGTGTFDMGNGVVRLIRNHEGYGHGKARGGKFRAYDRVAKGGVTSLAFDTKIGHAARQPPRPQRHRQQLQRRRHPVGQLADLRGVDGRAAPGLRTRARLRLRGPGQGQGRGRAGADQGDGPLRTRGGGGRPARPGSST